MEQKLTSKQRRFVEAYSGNGTEAARLAGYKGSDNTLAQQARDNLTKPHIAQAIKARENKEIRKLIATRKRRQEFWTEIMENEALELRDRLRASELLGKSEADFIDRYEHSGVVTLEDLVTSSMRAQREVVQAVKEIGIEALIAGDEE